MALLRSAKDLDGYAFALGALAHYAADNDGHRIGTNPAVPILYPKLKKKYGYGYSVFGASFPLLEALSGNVLLGPQKHSVRRGERRALPGA